MPGDCLNAAYAGTTVGRAKIIAINVDGAMACPGVVAVLTAADIPGHNAIGSWLVEESLATYSEHVKPLQTLLLRAQVLEMVDTDKMLHPCRWRPAQDIRCDILRAILTFVLTWCTCTSSKVRGTTVCDSSSRHGTQRAVRHKQGGCKLPTR